jgi:hypothetical protein
MRLGTALTELHQAESALAEELHGVLVRDLRRLYLLACECEIDWEMVAQGAKAARDRDLLATASHCLEQTTVQVKWLKTRIKEASPQALTVG